MSIEFDGKSFANVEELCKYYGISLAKLERLLERNVPLRKILKANYETKKENIDHEGNRYTSYNAMCEHYGTNRYRVQTLMNKHGYTLKDALLYKGALPMQATCFDHEGTGFASERDMCDYWQREIHTYRQRRKNGWTVEDALTKSSKWEIEGPDGVIYRSKAALAKKFGVSIFELNKALKEGKTIKEALEHLVKK